MRDILIDSLKESTLSVLPICAIVLAFSFILPLTTVALFITGAVLLVIGLGIFTLGSDMAILPIGEAIGSELTRSKKIGWIAGGGFLIGVVVTIAEPDLQVLTKQVPAVPDEVLVGAVAFGAGAFLVLALMRIVFQISLSRLFIVSYALVFLVAGIFSPDFLAVAFDSGGVTTGPITVPFILALGMGISTVLSSKNSEEDSFGLCALCSIGPIIAVLFLGIFYDSSSSGFAFESPAELETISQIPALYATQFVGSLKEVVTVLLPILTIFILFQILRLKLARTKMIKIMVGILYTILGLSIFLTGVNVGFMPVGRFLGSHIASFTHNWILIPLAALLGFFIVAAEPAVYILNKQVEDITSGAISQRVMQVGLSVGVSLAVCLAMLRIMFQINIWYFLLPCYVIALVQTKFTPKVFTAIAFDSGGVAAGTMAGAFLLPFGVGVCETLGGNVMTDAFGMIAMIATLPLITIQGIGILFQHKSRKAALLEPQIADSPDDLIIDMEIGGDSEPALFEIKPEPDIARNTLDPQTEPEENEALQEEPEKETVNLTQDENK
ncbi:MAG: DUF1538 domain-containing protein [Clostridium sp.]|uniref:DUF1538 domain-containing protein n=1 Tax=Clostridium sp. TaxID=1506 RepID=UPI0029064D39|nr:DUF1538 domain-containing protein [Clostridium sp.]MDU7338509.1 DUF1538 domain-containing protein [Clostridium sp.]